MANDKFDIIVLGATGFTGQLVVKYLASHPQRDHFSFAVAGRSVEKLQGVIAKSNAAPDTVLFRVDVTKSDQVESLVQNARVIINVVGPYWTWGTPVVRACVRHGVHYVDLCGESPWMYNMIKEFDYAATKTGAIIVPACGYDSIPSDASAFLANQTLKSIPTNGDYLRPGKCTSAHSLSGGASGGTIASIITSIEDVDPVTNTHARRQYALSPFVGLGAAAPFKWIYKLAVPGEKTLTGGLFVMAVPNKRVVQRSFGLLELEARESPNKETSKRRYGPEFEYDEFLETNSTLGAATLTSVLVFAFTLLMIRPMRAIIKRLIPQSGEGPSPESQKNGWFKCVNITESTSTPPVFVKTVIKGQGDPGYAGTCVMISESALSIVLPPRSSPEFATLKPNPGHASNVHALTPLARRGGLLTPMTAFGDVLIQRLRDTGRFEFSSAVVGDGKARKDV